MELKDIVRVTIKPIMKEAGFKTKGNDWWKKIEGGLLMMHLKKSFFSNAVNGFMWDFLMFVVPEKEIGNNINDIWIDHQSDCLEIKYLLPYYGYLMEQMGGLHCDFKIFILDMSKLRIIKGISVDETNEIVRNVFEEYVVPFLSRCNRLDDWHELETEARTNISPEIKSVLLFFNTCIMGGGYGTDSLLVERYKQYGLNRKLIEENFELLEKMFDKENSAIRKILGKDYFERDKKKVLDAVERVVCLAENSEINETVFEG